MAEFTYRADMLVWIADHGSDRLKLAVSTGSADDVLTSYRDDRLQFESPGWHWVQANKPDPLQEPTENQLTVLAAVQVDFPTAYLGTARLADLWPTGNGSPIVSLLAMGTPSAMTLTPPPPGTVVALLARPFLWGYAWSVVSTDP